MKVSDLEWASRCPICYKFWNKSKGTCPDHPGVVLVQVFAYDLGYPDGFPEGLIIVG